MKTDLERIKELTSLAINNLSREESITKYQMIINELNEMAERVTDVKQKANIAIHMIETYKK